MKKIVCLFSALALMLASCSNDESNSPVLVKKIVEIDEIPGTVTIDFIYIENKLSQEVGRIQGVLDPTYTKTYSYDGDLISSYSIESGKKLMEVNYFTYENNKLKTKLLREMSTGKSYMYKTTYTYNTDGSVSFLTVDFDENTKIESNPVNGKLVFENGNLVKEESVNASETISTTVEYDLKNNPFKNVVGVNLMLDNLDFGYSGHNKSKVVTVSTSPNSSVTTSYSNVFTYDNKDFPTNSVLSNKEGVNVGTTQYYY